MAISLHEASVGVFVPYLGNLSSLLDQAAAHAAAGNIDPAVLLNMRLSPTMYSLKQQVGEANRHATVAGALLAGRVPQAFSDTEPDIPELKARISVAIDFVQGLPRAEIEFCRRQGSRFHFQEWYPAKIYRKVAAADVQHSAVLFSRHDGLRHPAPRRRRACQEGFSGTAEMTPRGASAVKPHCFPCLPDWRRRLVRSSRSSTARSAGALRFRARRQAGSQRRGQAAR